MVPRDCPMRPHSGLDALSHRKVELVGTANFSRAEKPKETDIHCCPQHTTVPSTWEGEQMVANPPENLWGDW